MKTAIITSAALFLPLLTTQADEEKKITTTELPAAVLATVEKETSKTKISEVSMEKEDGKKEDDDEKEEKE